jgi:hypothetical protein
MISLFVLCFILWLMDFIFDWLVDPWQEASGDEQENGGDQ